MENFTLTIKDVAKYLQISEQMVYNLVKESKIKAFKIGSATRILYSDLNEYINEQKNELSKRTGNDSFFIEKLNFYIKRTNFGLHDITINFPLGKTMAIIGPSGSGKTMLLRCIAGLERIDSGKIFFGNKRYDELEIKERKLGFVFQNYALFPHLNLKSNIKFPLIIDKSNKNIAELETGKRIEEMSIESDFISNLPKTLPEGIKQLTSIAREKNHDIDLFLLDEPMSNLDKKIHLEIRIFFKKFIKEFNKTTIITLNNPEDALSISDYIAVLDNGNLIQFGETYDVYKNPVSKLVMEETTRLRLNNLDVTVKNGKIQPYGFYTEEYDGDYELCFRADEIELKENGIEAKITSKQFYDGNRIIADCTTKECYEMTLILPKETNDSFSFIPFDPKLFKK